MKHTPAPRRVITGKMKSASGKASLRRDGYNYRQFKGHAIAAFAAAQEKVSNRKEN